MVFFPSSLRFFPVSPCWERQMAYFEVAVMCAAGWMDGWDGWDGLSPHIFVFPLPAYVLLPPCVFLCMHLRKVRRATKAFGTSCVCCCVHLCTCMCQFVSVLSVFACAFVLSPPPHKGPARVHWPGGSACSVVMRASLVWLGGSSTIS